MKKKKKILPLISSLTLLTAPVILVTACSYEIQRYQAALPKDEQDRLLFDFIGVNFSVDAKSHFSNVFQQGMEFIKKEVEGIMAQQEFFTFFTKTLGYSEDLANQTFEEIKDTLGLNILANDYFNTINSGQSFESKNATKLVFQTNNWHQFGTTQLEYEKIPFYTEEDHNPNDIFTAAKLYDRLDDPKFDANIKAVAKYADDNYNDIIGQLTENKLKWATPEIKQSQPTFARERESIQEYQKKAERFKWWLRFRYQQYYHSVILPELNQTLFTMANILNTILKFDTKNESVSLDDGKYASQLQNWWPNQSWTSNYRLVWDYTTNATNATRIDTGWNSTSNSTKLPELMLDNKTINPAFIENAIATDPTLKNSIDPIFGINGFVNDTASKSYSNAAKKDNSAAWAENTDGHHYWGKDNKGSFAYSTPIYWIDVVKNLNFKYYQNRDAEDPKQNQWIIDVDQDYKGLIGRWNNSNNSSLSSSTFSQYIRGDYLNPDSGQPEATKEEYLQTQNMKWNLFWQMIYSLASQIESNPSKDVASSNFDIAAKILFPQYIEKEKIYNIEFWNAVNSYY